VPENAEVTVTHEPRKLGLVGKAIVGLMVVVTAGLVTGTVVVIRARRIEEESRFEETKRVWLTEHYLYDARKELREMDDIRPCSHYRWIGWGIGSPGRLSFTSAEDLALCDAWAQPIRFCCPGPIHKNGFDLISAGPNGVFEDGQGDDIVVGGDLPGGIATISSESGSGTTEGR